MSLMKQIEKGMLGVALVAGIGYAGCSHAMAEVVIVVPQSSNVTTLSSSQVMDIFLGKASQFPNGHRAVPVDLNEGSPERNEFYLRYAGKTPAQLKSHWSRLIFTGKGQPPKEVARSQEIKRLFEANPGMIGYMDRSAVDANVRVVQVMD